LSYCTQYETQAEHPATTEPGDLSKTIFTLLAGVNGVELYTIVAAAPKVMLFLYFKLLPTFFPEQSCTPLKILDVS
jgi:hypothetical protein